MKLLKHGLIGLATAFLAAQARADGEITNELYGAFNAAFQGEDESAKRAAAQAMAAAALADPEHPQAAMIAYEAAWGFCRIEACGEGRDAAAFALSQPESEEYPLMAEREMLSAYIEWNENPKRATRRDLDEKLTVIEALPASLISVVIFSKRMQIDIDSQRWSNLLESAGGMARHLEPVNSVLPDLWAEAALTEQVADFNRSQNRRVEPRLAHVRGKLAEAVQDAEPPVIEQLDSMKWRMEAWQLAFEAYFLSVPGKRPTPSDDIDAIIDSYPDFPHPSDDADDGQEVRDERPFCKGELKMSPPLRYSALQARRGQFGSVIANFSIEASKVTDVEILASIPIDGFRVRAAETLSKWTWIADEEQPEPDCRMSRTNIVLPMVFSLD